ncbi:hypothetical protein Bca4012_055660 [Brassica carinata]
MTGGDWTREAMSDDSLVAEALISLHHVEPPPPPPEKSGVSDLKLKWSVRQRRSKATPLSRKKGEQEHTRDSPSTPLSWSGATSLSGGGGGGSGVAAVEESSCAVKLSEAVRSKGHIRHFDPDATLAFFDLYSDFALTFHYVTVQPHRGGFPVCLVNKFTSDAFVTTRLPLGINPGCQGCGVAHSTLDVEKDVADISQTSVTPTTPFKRSRKKKTLAELKEEESLLLKEKKGLKNELASMRNLLKQQRARNESLKKLQAAAETQKNDDSSFLLPDLNIPLDNDNPS